MKKLYLTLLMLLVCILAVAQDKSVTFTTDNTEAMTINDPSTYSIAPWDEATKSVTLLVPESAYSVYARANSGYDIISVKNQNGDEFQASPSSYCNIYNSLLNDGDVITFTTAEKQPKVLICKADPTMVAIDFDGVIYGADQQTDGAWTLNLTDDSYLYIKALTDCMISSITDHDGNAITYYPTATQSVSGYSLPSGTTTYTVEAYNLNEARTDAFTLEVDGDPSKVSYRRNGIYQDITITEAVNEIRFNPDTELPVTISPASYGQSLYKVTLNGNDVEARGSNWEINPVNGDIVKVYTEYPDMDVPVSFSFANEGTENAITVSVNGEEIPAATWQSKDFTAKLGAQLSIRFNLSMYNVTLTENGNSVYAYDSYTVRLNKETGYEFVVTAEKIPTYKVTLTCTDPSHIQAFLGYSTEIPLENTTTVFEVSQKSSQIRFTPSATGVITGITTSTDLTFNNLNDISVYVSGDMSIDITTEPFVRDQKGILYLAEGGNVTEQTPNGWDYANITLSSSIRPHSMEIAPQIGYNFFDFSDYDKPFYIGFYPDTNTAIYYNNERIYKQQYGSAYPSLDEFKNGDVIKVYPAEVEPFTVTNEIQEGLKVLITTDYYTEHPENEASIAVLPGTYYTITPVSEEKVIVTVNDEPLEAEEGVYATTINADTKIVVSVLSAITGVGTDASAANNDVYNLQGILVKANASADDIKALPAGLYIIGGKKTIVR